MTINLRLQERRVIRMRVRDRDNPPRQFLCLEAKRTSLRIELPVERSNSKMSLNLSMVQKRKNKIEAGGPVKRKKMV